MRTVYGTAGASVSLFILFCEYEHKHQFVCVFVCDKVGGVAIKDETIEYIII